MRFHFGLMIQMSQQTRVTLQGWLQREMSPLGRAKRALAMLLLEQGHSYARIGQMGWFDRAQPAQMGGSVSFAKG